MNYYKYEDKRPFLSSEQMEKATRELFKTAKKENVKAALCGGRAMQLYGSDRMTRDLDFLANDALFTIPSNKIITFSEIPSGYKYKLGKVPVDWIIRADAAQFVYEAALQHRIEVSKGIWSITPEWLALLKLLARRGKDGVDLQWLLRQRRLINRKLLISNIRDIFDRGAFAVVEEMEGAFLEADITRARDERNNS